jgi:LmbE family N-acetylglucosaminyl deacetylase
MPDSSPPRVLAIHAHPDDIEFQCAGTLLLLKAQGCPIVMATMTAGDCGSAELGPDEVRLSGIQGPFNLRRQRQPPPGD